MEATKSTVNNLAGSLLLAHPSLKDPNFKHSVILVSAHKTAAAGGGAFGVVINHPLGIALGDINHSLQSTPLAEVPIFRGGPVASHQVILTAWQWVEPNQVFKLYFGINAKVAVEMKTLFPKTQIIAFLGYAGWGAGQIEQEIKENAWLQTPIKSILNHLGFEKDLWFQLMSEHNPLMLLMHGMPDDPICN